MKRTIFILKLLRTSIAVVEWLLGAIRTGLDGIIEALRVLEEKAAP